MRRARHGKVVRENAAAEPELAAQVAVYPARGEARRQRIHLVEHHMRRHDGRQTVVDETAVGEEILVQVRQLAVVHRQGHVRIRHDIAMPGEVLGSGGHAGVLQPAHERNGELCHGLGRTVKRAVADDFAGAEIEVHHRREGQVDAHGPQFRTQQPAHLPR